MTTQEPVAAEAEAALAASLEKIFGEVERRILPEVAIASVHSWEQVPGDGLQVLLDMADGSTVSINLRPGRPITATRV